MITGAEHIGRDEVYGVVRFLAQRLLHDGYSNSVESLKGSAVLFFKSPASNQHDISWLQQKSIFVIFTQRQADWSDVISENSVTAEVNQGNIRVVCFRGEVGMNYNIVSLNDLCCCAFWMFDLVSEQFTKTDLDNSR